MAAKKKKKTPARKKTITDAAEKKTDGWRNELTGLNMYARDKRERTLAYQTSTLSYQELSWLYDGEDLAKKIVQKPVKAALRGGWEIIDVSESEQQFLTDEYKRLGFPNVLRDSLYWDGLYGGGLLVIGADDSSEDLSKPLGQIKEVRYLQAIPRHWVTIVKWEGSEPDLFRINPDDGKTEAFTIHASRACWLQGGSISTLQRATNDGWGLSVLEPVKRTVRDFVTSYDGAFMLVQDFSQAIYKMTGLSAALGQKKQSAIRSRLEAMDMARGIIKALVLDADGGEEFERKSTSVAGLPELLDRFEQRVSAAADIPVTVLFGRSPAGMNATGESDLENWYARIEEDRQERVLPIIEKITAMLLGRAEGWSVKFAPLHMLSEQEQADLHLKQAQADQIYINLGVLDSAEVRQSRFGGDEYSIRTELMDDVSAEDLTETLRAMEALENAQEAENLESDSGGSQAAPAGEIPEESA